MRKLDAEAAGIGPGLEQERRAAVAEDISPPAPWWATAIIITGGVASTVWTGFLGWLLYHVFSGV